MTKPATYHWEFKARFRRNAFGWRSQPAIQRIKQAVSEIKKMARGDVVLAADGAVMLLERLSPALEKVDSSSGSIGTAVNHAIDDLVPIIANAPADPATRDGWLERLWAALEADEMPYIETLGGFWGELCASKAVSSQWADRLMSRTRSALNPEGGLDPYFHGSSACLSALYESERYQDIVDILQVDTIWAYKRWVVRALTAMGKKSDALRYAGVLPWTLDPERRRRLHVRGDPAVPRGSFRRHTSATARETSGPEHTSLHSAPYPGSTRIRLLQRYWRIS